MRDSACQTQYRPVLLVSIPGQPSPWASQKIRRADQSGWTPGIGWPSLYASPTALGAPAARAEGSPNPNSYNHSQVQIPLFSAHSPDYCLPRLALLLPFCTLPPGSEQSTLYRAVCLAQRDQLGDGFGRGHGSAMTRAA